MNFKLHLNEEIKIGNWLVFNLGRDSKFNLINFLKQFSFYDKDMCNKIKDKQYCLNHILREENDVNIFENKGFFEIKNFENYETFFFL